MSDSSEIDDDFSENMPLSESLIQRGQRRVGEKYAHLKKPSFPHSRNQSRQQRESSSAKGSSTNKTDFSDLEDEFDENMPLSQSLVQRAQRRVGEKYAHLKKTRPSRHSSKIRISGNEADDSSEMEDDFSENMPLSDSLIQRGNRRVGTKYQHLLSHPRKRTERDASVHVEPQNINDDVVMIEDSPVSLITAPPPSDDMEVDDAELLTLVKQISFNAAESDSESDRSIFQSTPQRPGHRLKRGSAIGITPIVKEWPNPKRPTLVPEKISDSSQRVSPDRINVDNSDVQVIPGTQSSSEEADVSLGREKSTNHLNKLSQLPSSNSISSPLHSMTLENDEKTTASSEIHRGGSSQMGGQMHNNNEQSQGARRSLRHSIKDQSSVLSSVKEPRTSETFSTTVDGDQDLSQRKSLKTFTRESNTRNSKSSSSSTSRSQSSKIQDQFEEKGEENNATQHSSRSSSSREENHNSDSKESRKSQNTSKSNEFVHNSSISQRSETRPRVSETFSTSVNDGRDLSQRKSLKTLTRESNTRNSKSSLSSTSRSQSSKIPGTRKSSEEADVSFGREKSTNHLNKLSQLPSSNSISSPLHSMTLETDEETTVSSEIHLGGSSQMGAQREDDNEQSQGARRSIRRSIKDQSSVLSSVKEPRTSETFSTTVDGDQDLSQRKSLKTFTRESNTRNSKSSSSSTSRSQSSKIQDQFEEKGEENNATQHSSRSSSSREENHNSDSKESRKSQNTSKSNEFVHNSSISQRSETRPRVSETFSTSVNDGRDLSQRKSLKRERSEDEESADDNASNSTYDSVFHSGSMTSRGSVTTLDIDFNLVEPVTNPPLSYNDMLAAALARSKTMSAVGVGNADLLLNFECRMSGSGRQLKTNCLYPMLNLRRTKVPKRKEQKKPSPVKLSESPAKVSMTTRSSINAPISSNSSIRVLKPSTSSIKLPITSRLSGKASIRSNSSKISRHKRLKGNSQSNQSVTPARIYGPILNYLGRTLSQSSFQSSQRSTSSIITNDKIGITMDQVDEKADENMDIEKVTSSQSLKTQLSQHETINKEIEAVESENDEQDEGVTSHSSRANRQTHEFAKREGEEENDKNVEKLRKSQSLIKKSLRHEITNREMEVIESEDEVVAANTSLKSTRQGRQQIGTSESEEDVVEHVDKEKTIQFPQKQRPKLNVAPNKAPPVAKVSGSKRKLVKTTKKKTLADLQDNSNLISKDYLTQATRENKLKFSKSELDSFHKFLNKELETLCDSLCEQAGRSYGMFTYRQLEDALKKKKLIDPALGRNSLLIMMASILPHSTYEKAKGLLIPKDGEHDTY